MNQTEQGSKKINFTGTEGSSANMQVGEKNRNILIMFMKMS